MFAFSACGKKNNDDDDDDLITITSYSIANVPASLERGDDFSVEGCNLVLNYSDGTVSIIPLTNAMLASLPDMNTIGNKNITLTFGGFTYSFSISVVENTETVAKNEYLQKIQTFLNTYQNSGAEINATLTANLTAIFAGEESNLNESVTTPTLTEEMLATFNAEDIYNLVLNSIMTSSLDFSITDITSIELLQSNFDLTNALKALGDELSVLDYDYYAKEIVFSQGDFYLSNLTDLLCKILNIPAESVGHNSVYAVINNQLYTKLYNEEELDLVTILEDLNEIFQEYSEMDEINKVIVDSLFSSAQEDPQHSLSTLLLDIYENIPHKEDTVEVETLKDQYVTIFTNMVKTLEDAYNLDVNFTLMALIENSGQLVVISDELIANDCNTGLPIKEIDFALNLAYNALNLNIVDFIAEYDLVNMFSTYLCTAVCNEMEIDITSQTYTDLDNLVSEYINKLINQEEIDQIDYINQLGIILDYDVTEFTTNYETFGTPYIIKKLAETFASKMEAGIVEKYGQAYFDNLYTSFVNFATALDEIPINGIDNVLLTAEDFSSDVYQYALDESAEDYYLTVFDVLATLLDSEIAINQSVIDLLTEYQSDIASGIAYNVAYSLKIDTESQTYIDFEALVNEYLSKIINDEEIDQIYYINQVSIILGYDITAFTSNYEEFGNPYFFKELANIYISEFEEDIVSAYGQEYYDNLYSAFINLANYIDEIPSNGVGNPLTLVQEFVTQLHQLTVYQDDLNREIAFNILSIMLNSDSAIYQTLLSVVDEYRSDIVEYLTSGLSYAFNIESGSDAYNAIYLLINSAVDDIVDDTFVVEDLLTGLKDIIEDYINKEAQPLIYSVGALMLVLTDADLDYNEVFSFIPLPEEIESIDYNLMIERMMAEETYETIFSIENAVVEVVEDAQGHITGEILTVTINVDFDIMISQLSGEFTISFEIVY